MADLSDLEIAQKQVYAPNGLVLEHLVCAAESQEYGACTFELNHDLIHFRIAKITPTKEGLFVTFWKRLEKGPIMPYSDEDPFDFLVVSVRKENRLGQFVFPKAILKEKGILSQQGKGGKRALRVYPPWDKNLNAQAKKTQAWQQQYFIEISEGAATLTTLFK